VVTYVKGDATRPVGEGRKIIAHIVNDSGKWGAGFVLALDRLSMDPRNEYLGWYSSVTNPVWGGLKFLPMGIVQYVDIDNGIAVANMVAQHGTYSELNRQPLSYRALEYCLEGLAENADFLEATVHMPRIGCGLARGNWNVVESIINRTLTLRDIDVTVYDL